VDIEDVSSCKKILKIEIPQEDVNAEIEKVYEELRTKASVPGFRKGRAPRTVLRMRFGEYVKGEVIEKLVPPAYEKAVEDANLEILAPLDIDDISPPLSEMSVKENEPLIFEVNVSVKPKITIPDLAQLEVEKGDVNVPREDVDKLVDQMREERASFIPVEDRSVQEGDYITLSVLATQSKPQALESPHAQVSEQSDSDSENLKADKEQERDSDEAEVLEDLKDQVLEVGENMPIPELVQHLVGMESETEKEFSISFPVDHQVQHLAGKEVEFYIKVHKITEKHLPDLDDDFAKDLGADDLQSLVGNIWNQLVEVRRQEQREKQKSDLLNQLLEKSQFEIPEFFVEKQAEALKRVDIQQTRRQESEITEEELSQYQSAARDTIRRTWILEGIAKSEEVEVTEAEIEAEVRRSALAQNRDPQKYMNLLKAARRIEGIREAMWEDKIFDLLIEKASQKRTLIV
jgi:trigger factor